MAAPPSAEAVPVERDRVTDSRRESHTLTRAEEAEADIETERPTRRTERRTGAERDRLTEGRINR